MSIIPCPPAGQQPGLTAEQRILEGIAPLWVSGGVYELRVPHTPKRTVSGYFDDPAKLAGAAARWDGKASGVYLTLNPVVPALLARSNNRCREYATTTTADSDVERRVWLPLDFDPVRPAGISSSDEEHEAALARAKECSRWLIEDIGVPRDGAILADSGNGAHLLLHIELPNDDPSTEMVKRCLEAVALFFGDSTVAVDTSTYNAARIWKVYGTLAAKGENVPERSHRVAHILYVPDGVIETVERSVLARLVALTPPATTMRSRESSERFDLETFISRYLAGNVHHSGPWNQGRKWVLSKCPFNPDHTDRSAVILEMSSGALAFRCHHNSCQGRDWQELRALYESADSYGACRRDDSDIRSATRVRIPSEEGATGTPAEMGEQVVGGGCREDGEPILVCMADIKPEPIDWLWHPRMPKGALVMLDGDPGAGKSYLSLAIAAPVSLGAPLPDGGESSDLDGQTQGVGRLNRESNAPGNVLLLLAEDDYATVVRPRLDKLGADSKRITALKGIYRRDGDDFLILDPEVGLPALRKALEKVRPKLVCIDPVLAYVDGKLDAHRQNAVRSVTRPLAEMARDYGVVILALRHLTKSDGGKAIYRGQTSIDWVAAARSALMVGFHPEDRKLPVEQRRRVLAQYKSNEAYGASLVFKIDHLGLTWLPGTVEVSADDLVAPMQQEKAQSKLELAMDWLLENHKTVERRADDVIRDAMVAGHTERTLRRAFTGLQGKAKAVYVKGGKGVDHWVWLPLSGSSSERTPDGPDLDGQTKVLGNLNADGLDSMRMNGNGHNATLQAEQDRLDIEEYERLRSEWAGYDQ